MTDYPPLSKAHSDGSGCFTLMSIALILGGCLGCFLFWQSYSHHEEFSKFPKVAITLSNNQVVRVPTSETDTAPYKLNVTYTYEWKGRRHQSSHLATGGNAYSSYRLATIDAALVAKTSEARVNPEDPTNPVLLPGSQPSWWLAALPGFFVLSGLYSLIRSIKNKSSTSTPTIETLQKGGRVMRRVGVVLLALAGVITYFMLNPILNHLSSQSWPEVPCTVVASSLLHHTGGDSTTYSTDVFYEYDVAGNTYRSNRLNFDTSTSSNRSYYQELLNDYPAGARTVAFVNPEDPTDAVLRRDYGSIWILFLFPGVLAFFGAGCVLLSAKAIRASGHPALTTSPSMSGVSPQPPAFVSPRSSRITGFLGLLLIAMFWNGMIGFFITMILQQESKGALWFMSIFALVGLGLIVATFNKFLTIFSPSLMIRVNTSPVRVGSTTIIDWKIDGNKQKLEGATITMQAEAIASYRRGTDTITVRKSFLKLEQALPATTLQQGFGTVRFDIPDQLMPSFISTNNRFEWNLSVALQVVRWPDSTDNYPLVVYPPTI